MLLVLNAQPSLKNTSLEEVRIQTFAHGEDTQADKKDDNTFATEFQPSVKQLLALHPGYVQRPAYRPITKFENRGLKLGHGVWDLVYKKKTDAS